MTEKQKLFALDYCKDLNATRAYKVVYKNCKTDDSARACSSKLLAKANIRAFIDEELEKIKSDKIADVTEVMQYLTSVLRGEIEEEVVVVEGEGDGHSSAATVKKEVQPKDRNKAAELLGKRYGMFTEKVEVSKVPQIVDDIG